MTTLVLDPPNSIYARPLLARGERVTYDRNKIGEVDAVLFTGGSDVTPGLYTTAINPRTNSNLDRDVEETKIYNAARKRGIPCVGICRGAQFLTVCSGGTLLQHVEGHAINGTHPALCLDSGKEIHVTSTHHQMMNPFNIARNQYDLLSVSLPARSKIYEEGFSGTNMNAFKRRKLEPEVVYYKHSKSLCVQFHPEYMAKESEGWLYFQELLGKYIYK